MFASIGLQPLAGDLGLGHLFEKERKRVCAIVALIIDAMAVGATLMLLVGVTE